MNLRQMTYKIIPTGFKDGYVDFSVTANIRSNARWTMSIIDGPDRLSSSVKPPTSGTANITGSDFKYRFSDISNKGEVTFRFSSPDGLFVDQDITVNLMPISALFAKSNIVYKVVDGKPTLTFAETMDRNAEIPANAQGLFFRWGSLIAISTLLQDDVKTGFNPNTDVIFKPANFETAIGSYDNIPHYDNYHTWDGSSNSDGFLASAFPAEQPGRGYHSQNGLGDICRYISDQEGWVKGRWRMPTIYELRTIFRRDETPWRGPESYFYGLPYGSFGIQKNTSRDGLTPISSGVLGGSGVDYTQDADGDGQDREPNHEEKVFFPASGEYYYNSTPGISDVGVYGAYNMSTRGANLLGIDSDGFSGWDSNGYTESASTIRCIRDGIFNTK